MAKDSRRLRDVGRVDLGLGLDAGRARRVVALEPGAPRARRPWRSGSSALAGARLGHGDPGALEGQRPLARGAAVLGVEAGRRAAPQRGLVDGHHGLEVVAAGEVVPEPDRVPALLAAGLGDGRLVVDREARLDGLDGDGRAVDGGLDRGADLLGQPGPEAVGRLGLRVAADARPR